MFYCECKKLGYQCDLCTEKREIAFVFKSVVLRMKLALEYGDPFIFAKEKQELTDRIMWEQWAYISLYQRGMEWEVK